MFVTMRARSTAAMVLFLALVGCDSHGLAEVWVKEGATRDSLTFGLGKLGSRTETPSYVSSFVVQGCRDSAASSTIAEYWRIELKSGDAGLPDPSQLTYGVTPTTHTVVTPAKPLDLGCYEVAGGVWPIRFVVDSTGQAHEVVD